MTEDVITDLSKVGGLLVIARNSSFAYKGQGSTYVSVARELGVRSVLEGSIRRAGDRVRITAQLIDAETGGQLWAERYDRELSDIFAVQDEITRRIVDALKIKLSPGEAARLDAGKTTNSKAHDFLPARARGAVRDDHEPRGVRPVDRPIRAGDRRGSEAMASPMPASRWPRI